MKRSNKIVVYRLLVFTFCLCFGLGTFYVLRERNNPLFRYPYGTEQERLELIDVLDGDQINDLINAQLQPQQVLPYAREEGFNVSNTLYYNLAMETQPAEPSVIVYFVNTYRNRFDLNKLRELLSWLTYPQLIQYYQSGMRVPLADNPLTTDTMINADVTLWTWRPEDLAAVGEDVLLRQNAATAWQEMASAAAADGIDLVPVSGWIGMDQQPAWKQYSSYPLKTYGSWEEQLGTVVHVAGFDEWNTAISAMDPSRISTQQAYDGLSEEQRQTALWLEEHAWQYGWIVRFPNGKETITGVVWQPFVLRYVGQEQSREVHDKQLTWNEMVDRKQQEEK